MDFSKVHHIAIIGTNFEEMKEFYVDKLGFTLLGDSSVPIRRGRRKFERRCP